MGKRKLVALLYLSSWCLVMVEWLFLAVPWGCLGLVILVVKGYLVPFCISQIPILVFMLFYSEVSVAGDLFNISLFEE